MDFRSEILALPRALREMLEKGRGDYDRLVRRVRWGERPIFLVGAGAAYPVALSGALAFETLCEWPVVARPAPDFAAYSTSLIGPRSVVFLISRGEHSEGILDLVRWAKARGSTVLLLSPEATGSTQGAADAVFVVPPREGLGHGFGLSLGQHAAIHYIALVTARALKKHRPQFDDLETEFTQLPHHAEWVINQLTEAVRSLSREIPPTGALTILAGGFYYPVAREWALTLERRFTLQVRVLTTTDTPDRARSLLGRDHTVLVLSGSRCRVKDTLQQLVVLAQKAGARVLAVTDGGDPEVSRRAALALRLPTLHEMTGSILTLFLLGWTTHHITPADQGRTPRPR